LHFAIIANYNVEMKKVQTAWSEIADTLYKRLSESEESTIILSKKAKINYFAIYRLRQGPAKNRTVNAVKLCNYFSIETEIPGKVQNPCATGILAAVEDVWDGSKDHADLLANLIRSTRSFKIRHTTT